MYKYIYIHVCVKIALEISFVLCTRMQIVRYIQIFKYWLYTFTGFDKKIFWNQVCQDQCWQSQVLCGEAQDSCFTSSAVFQEWSGCRQVMLFIKLGNRLWPLSEIPWVPHFSYLLHCTKSETNIWITFVMNHSILIIIVLSSPRRRQYRYQHVDLFKVFWAGPVS